MAIIQVNNLTFCYEGSSFDNIFEDATFTLDSDWKLGFIGRNGRGKTTFFHLLMKKYPYKGSIFTPVEFDLFPVEIENKEDFVIDIINRRVSREEWEIRKEMNLINLSNDVLFRTYSTLSNGEQTKVQIVILFLKRNHFLLFDEPTNHLDEVGKEHLIDYLNGKKGFIIVSHDRYFLDAVVDHILSINRNNIEVQSGNYSSWQENKMGEDNFEMKQNEKLEKEIKLLNASARRTAGWSDKIESSKIGAADKGFVGHKAAKMMQRSKNMENRVNRSIEEKSSLLKNVEGIDPLKIFPLEHFHSFPIECRNLSLYYGDNLVAENINFRVKSGDRIQITGGNGRGKSTLIKLLIGALNEGENDFHIKGYFNVRSDLKISYTPQNTTNLSGELDDFINNHELDEPLFKSILRKLDFDRVQFEKAMDQYSEGQKKKVYIAKSLCEKAHIYIWDEPLNYIDIYSRLQIEEVILKYSPTVIFVEHDKVFSNKIKTKAIEL